MGAAPTARQGTVISLRRISKTYGGGDTQVHALSSVSLDIDRGDFVAIMGASGSGKSTLMNVIGCLDVATSGRYRLAGSDVGALTDDEQATVRNRRIGFVFQSFNLIPRTTALANVELPLVYAGVKRAERRERAVAALTRVGLAERLDYLPNQLSGGQQQRVAIARAVVTSPAIILADEPTGALDSVSAAEVLSIFEQLNMERRTVVMITHDHDVAAHAKRTVRFRDGQIVSDERTTTIDALPPMVGLTRSSVA
ncbi:MAG: ABC transporter ATP-binding protein [Ilumatobacteraceae bacterium]